MTEREAYIAFSAVEGIGPVRLKLLTDYFGSARAAWNTDKKELLNIGLGQKLTAKLVHFRNNFDPTRYEQELLQKEINVITRVDSEFPKRLLEIPDRPIALFIKGTISSIDRAIGVVGTRKPTPYGRQITQSLTKELVEQDFTIVSGLARGVDGIAHRTAIESGGITVAVLGCGVDVIYPPEHKELYAEIIAKGGAVISEVSPGHTVLKGLFPARNRIISGLSLGIIVTEGAEDSGSLITARYAAEQGRDVFAVPGPITSYLSAGPVKLIKQGAKVVTGIEDILEELNEEFVVCSSPFAVDKEKLGKLTEEEKKIVTLLESGEVQFDELVREIGLSASEVGTIVSVLELNGIIANLGNGKYGLK